MIFEQSLLHPTRINRSIRLYDDLFRLCFLLSFSFLPTAKDLNYFSKKTSEVVVNGTKHIQSAKMHVLVSPSLSIKSKKRGIKKQKRLALILHSSFLLISNRQNVSSTIRMEEREGGTTANIFIPSHSRGQFSF